MRDELKVEVAFNYKTDDTREILAKYKKESGGFQVYVDNVAGPTLEAALEFISARGRVVSIGAINDYNGSPHGIKNIFYVIGKELKMEGYAASSFLTHAHTDSPAKQFHHPQPPSRAPRARGGILRYHPQAHRRRIDRKAQGAHLQGS